jgi:hypothetical protein
MVVNDDAGDQEQRIVLGFFASKLAPTVSLARFYNSERYPGRAAYTDEPAWGDSLR